MRFQDLPIKRKLVALILTVSITVLSIAAVIMLSYELRNSRKDMVTNLSATANVIAANSSAALVFDDPRVAQEILSAVRAEPEITAAALYDKSGALYVQYPTNLPVTELPPAPAGAGARFYADYLALFSPVVQDNLAVGTLYLKADFRQVHRRIAIYSIMLCIVLAGSGFLALFLSNLFEWRISRPLLELAHLAKAVSVSRDYSVRATKTTGDELGTLTDAFNAMLAQIQAGDLALRDSERRFREMIDALPAAVYTTDAQGRLTHFNPAAAEMSGRVPELGSDKWCANWKFFGVDGTPIAHEECPMALALRDGQAIRGVEIMAEKPDATRIWFVPYPTPLRGSNGVIEGSINMLVDITQRKWAEEALRESEQRFRMIADNIPVLAWTADRSFEVNWYNRRWYEYSGTTPLQMLGRGWEQLHHPDHLERVWQKLRQAIERREVWEDTFPLKGRNGTYRWFLSRARPFFDQKGRITRWFGTNADVTEQREAQQAVIRLAAIVESSQDAIISMTLDGIVLTWNRGAERMFGYLAAEIVGRSIEMVLPPERRAEKDLLQERQRQGETMEHFETTRVRKDGTQLEVSLSISPLRDASGKVIGVSKIARDITEKKQAERDLERARDAAEAANRAKDDFLAALSHELRTPLMPVMFTISMLLQDQVLPAKLRENLAMMRRNIEIQSRMINDLLDLSRIRSNRLQLELDVADLNEILLRALEVCRSQKKFAEVTVETCLEATEHHVRADADRLQQVFWNLIQNSMKFTPSGGKITVRTRNQDGMIHIAVTDNGCGIEPEVLTKIFEPFEQGGRKGKETLQGLGLGLAIAQRIVVAHQGTLSAASAGKGCGATFAVELPTVTAPDTPLPPESTSIETINSAS